MKALLVSTAAAVILALTMSATSQRAHGSTPVVVELFTSQGCSSCPPADELISQLAQQHAQIIPLAFHVDYWDNAFWRDPFSSRLWTQRQMMYVRTFKLNSAYTPQMVVNGSQQFVGSNSLAMNAAIDEASHSKPAGSISLDAQREGAKLTATIHADAPPGSDIVLVVFENGIATKIQGGENRGLTVTDDAIVRRLWRVQNGTVTMPIDASWKHVGVAAFVQDRNTLAIGAAAVKYF